MGLRGQRAGWCVGLTVLVALCTPARADYFVELVGGLAIPAGTNDWTTIVTPSPKLGARGGTMFGDLGGLLAVDWTPEELGSEEAALGIGAVHRSLDRFRVIASAMFRHRVASAITLSGRAGAGIDIAHGRVSDLLDFGTTPISNTDVGYAFEFGVGMWFDVGFGDSQIGLELAVPLGHHARQPYYRTTELTFNYTSVDIDLLVGLRF